MTERRTTPTPRPASGPPLNVPDPDDIALAECFRIARERARRARQELLKAEPHQEKDTPHDRPT
jgi:hypothetical protein